MENTSTQNEGFFLGILYDLIFELIKKVYKLILMILIYYCAPIY